VELGLRRRHHVNPAQPDQDVLRRRQLQRHADGVERQRLEQHHQDGGVAPIPPPPPPTANFSASQRSGTLIVDFTDTSTGTPTSWSWTFGDNTSSTQQNPTKTYAAAGDYSVMLTATNAGGSNSVTQTVTVAPIPPPPPPTANFTSSQRVKHADRRLHRYVNRCAGGLELGLRRWHVVNAAEPDQDIRHCGRLQRHFDRLERGGPNSVTKTVTVVPIPATTTVVADAFGRTTNNGWGNADTGGTYNLLGPASNFSVGGGVGTMVVPTASTTRSAMLPATAADTDTTFRVRVNKVPAGGSYFVYAASRVNGSSEYRPRILINPNGTVSAHASVLVNGSESPIGSAVVVPGLTPTANAWIRFRAQVTGANPTTIRVKAWADGTTEPTAWNYTATSTTAALQGSGSLGYASTSTPRSPTRRSRSASTTTA
jgi:PKD repeat protein